MADDDLDLLDDGESSDDTTLQTEADVDCPHCGATTTIALDPAGGKTQEYVEDCEVCCRAWTVRVWYHAGGGADVDLQATE
jgi:transposase-like protein